MRKNSNFHKRRLFLVGNCFCLFTFIYLFYSSDTKSDKGQYSVTEIGHQVNGAVRVLCFISRLNQVDLIRETWGKQCNILFLIRYEENELAGNLSAVYRYIWTKYKEDIDWFIKTDDESYVLMRNLRRFVSTLNSSAPVWFNWPSTGSGKGFVFSNETFRRFVSESDNEVGCRDIETISECLSTLGATLIETRDHQGMERFIPFDLKQKDCCSQSLIAFYGVKQSQMFLIEFLLSYNETGGPVKSTIRTGEPEFTENRIFFLETSGRPSLKLRHACAVESAAKENANRPVQVIIFNSTADADSRSMRVFSHYPNIQVYSLTFEQYFADTPFEQWFRDARWQQSPHQVAHLSDYLRILSLWKGGGIYMDTDFVVLRSMQGLANFSCNESPHTTSNGLIGLDVGHPLLEILTGVMSSSYEPNEWTSNGPDALTRALRTLCNETNIALMSPEKCSGYNLLPANRFYPIHFSNWMDFFEESSGIELSQFNESYALHVWNKLSYNATVRVGSKQLYALAAAEHCPHVFATAATEF